MKKILFLSSSIVISTLVCLAHAHAADDIITGGDGTCNETVLGTSENLATANTIATWSLNEYDCPAGQYLLVDGDNIACTPCASGSYCPGGIYTVESENMGTNICPTDYTSDASATAQSECYQGCSLECQQQACPEHSTTCTHGEFNVAGRQYFDSTCNAYQSICPITDFSCDAGYTKTFVDVAQFGDSGGFISVACPLDGDTSDTSMGPYNYCNYGVAPGEFILSADPADFGIKYVLSVNSYGPDTQGVIAIEGADTYILENADFKPGLNDGNHVWFRPDELWYMDSKGRYIFDTAMDFSMDFMIQGNITQEMIDKVSNTLSGIDKERLLDAMESVQQNPSMDNLSKTAFEIYNLYKKSVKTNAPWIYLGTYNEKEMNAEYAHYAAIDYDDFADTLEGSGIGAAYCRYNTINVDWNPDDGSENIAGTCYYNGIVDIPEYIPTKPGYTFKGWKLVTE